MYVIPIGGECPYLAGIETCTAAVSADVPMPLPAPLPGGSDAHSAIISRSQSILRIPISACPLGMAMPAWAKVSIIAIAKSVRIFPLFAMNA